MTDHTDVLATLERLLKKATPGPVEVFQNMAGTVVTPIKGRKPDIALHGGLGHPPNEELANAKLHAALRNAAPALLEVAKAAREFRDNGTTLTTCSRGACQRVVEHKDASDPQAKMFAALRALDKVTL